MSGAECPGHLISSTTSPLSCSFVTPCIFIAPLNAKLRERYTGPPFPRACWMSDFPIVCLHYPQCSRDVYRWGFFCEFHVCMFISANRIECVYSDDFCFEELFDCLFDFWFCRVPIYYKDKLVL